MAFATWGLMLPCFFYSCLCEFFPSYVLWILLTTSRGTNFTPLTSPLKGPLNVFHMEEKDLWIVEFIVITRAPFSLASESSQFLHLSPALFNYIDKSSSPALKFPLSLFLTSLFQSIMIMWLLGFDSPFNSLLLLVNGAYLEHDIIGVV